MNAARKSHRNQLADGLAVLVLLILWAGFFWRFLTPVEADQVSLAEGDFSGQFVAFGAYQAQRMWAGEVPLWNPYNNGGHPFLADNQSAVFYPPRLLTIALTSFSRQWTYHALELEMMAHMLLTGLLMYAFLRRLTREEKGSIAGALAGAITWTYGGFMTGYPPLQLALLEAVAWTPLLLLGGYQATSAARPDWRWLIVSGLALGLSVMAGHPQTNWFLALLFIAYLGYRIFVQGWRWTHFVAGVGLVGGLAVGLAAVQLLPAFEYLQHTTRIGMGFDAKSNGFPIQDVIQLLFPRIISEWSPLYVGIVGFVLVGVGIWRRVRAWAFWSGVALVGVLFSFGGNASLYGLLYNVLPGLKLFRGQERAASVVAVALAVLVGLAMSRLAGLTDAQARASRVFVGRLSGLIVIVTGFVTLVAFVLWLGPAQELYADTLPALAFSALIALLALAALLALLRAPSSRVRQGLVVALIVFDLFTIAGDNLLVESVPSAQRLRQPEVLTVALQDSEVPPARVDGIRGVMGNFGSMWGIPDIRGISPLWLQGPSAIIGQAFPNPLAWELFAVKYVFTDWQELPVPSEVVGKGEDGYGPINVHELADPRPVALLMDQVTLVDSDDAAHALLNDPGFDPRQAVLLDADDGLAIPQELSAQGRVSVDSFLPEQIVMTVAGQELPAVLSVSLPDYPGWRAWVDGQEAPIVRAYGGLSALILPGGAARVELLYQPWTFTAGAVVSALWWAGLLVIGIGMAVAGTRRHQQV